MRILTILTTTLATLTLAAGCATFDESVTPESTDQPLVQGDDGDAVTPPTQGCRHFVDEDGDGVCDRRAAGECAGGSCRNFVDADGDGVCDHAGQGRCGAGPGFVDADGDGVCDHGGRRRGRHFVDQDGDGVCDRRRGTP